MSITTLRQISGVACIAVLLASCAGAPNPPTPALSDGLLRDAVRALEEGEPPPTGVEMVGSGVVVEVMTEGSEDGAIASVERVGGEVRGTSPGIVLAVVPFDQLEVLEADPVVDFLRVPLRIDEAP
ncbi:MAG: hypothetical protein ACRDVD_04960 [Acidimicrobiia bacterium]